MKYSVSGTADLLHRIGFVFKKITGVPCECDIAEQQKFVSKMSKIFKSQDVDTVIYYADGVHPTHNCRTTCGWIEKGCEFKQPMVSGRDRVNINALINARDVTDVVMLDCLSVNADSTQTLYQKALEYNVDAKKGGVCVCYTTFF